MKIALAQINCVPGGTKANLEKHQEFIDKAIKQQADLIVFPELSLTGDKVGPDVPDVSLGLDSIELVQIANASRNIDVVIGLSERSDSSVYNRYNTAFYISKGRLIHRHRKLFLVNYAVFDEMKHYVAGNNLQAFPADQGRMCLLICNDVWHPVTPYIAALDGAEFLLVPSNSARDTLADHVDIPKTWEHMNRSYSTLLGFYTIFVNCVGTRQSVYGEHTYWGGSEIIDPQGRVVVKAPYDEEALVFGEVDVQLVRTQRYKAPLIRDARLWLVQQEIERLGVKRSEDVVLKSPAVTLPTYEMGD